MQRSPVFDFFENLCVELDGRAGRVIPADEIAEVDDLKDHFNETDNKAALGEAMRALTEHFDHRRSQLPFELDPATGEFRVRDATYVTFVARVAGARGQKGEGAKNFEVEAFRRLDQRLCGDLHLVGAPRKTHRRKVQLEGYLRDLGFDKGCLNQKDKDGGLDILWLPPLGAIPMRPIVSLQCKNGRYDQREAHGSIGKARTTLARHSHMKAQRGLFFVLFNDYIDSRFVEPTAGQDFIPLGLTDLGPPYGVSLRKEL